MVSADEVYLTVRSTVVLLRENAILQTKCSKLHTNQVDLTS